MKETISSIIYPASVASEVPMLKCLVDYSSSIDSLNENEENIGEKKDKLYSPVLGLLSKSLAHIKNLSGY